MDIYVHFPKRIKFLYYTWNNSDADLQIADVTIHLVTSCCLVLQTLFFGLRNCWVFFFLIH